MGDFFAVIDEAVVNGWHYLDLLTISNRSTHRTRNHDEPGTSQIQQARLCAFRDFLRFASRTRLRPKIHFGYLWCTARACSSIAGTSSSSRVSFRWCASPLQEHPVLPLENLPAFEWSSFAFSFLVWRGQTLHKGRRVLPKSQLIPKAIRIDANG